MDPLILTIVLLSVFALGAVVLAASFFRRAVNAESRAALVEARLDDQEATKKSFEALASQSLRSAQRDLRRHSKAELADQRELGNSELNLRRSQIDALVKPMQDALERTKRELERQGKRSDLLDGTLEAIRKGQGDLTSKTNALTQALRRPNVRGRYGEVQLKRVVELAGMRDYCDFDTQVVLQSGGDETQRPDMVVRLPNGRSVVIDAKTPIDSYMDAASAQTEAAEDLALDAYGKAVLLQVRRLGKKEYWKHFEPAPEFVVMFLPGDQFIDAALRASPGLIEEAARSNVLLASPSSLIGLLRAVHVGWRENQLTESAQELFQLGRELHERASGVLRHASELGTHLERTRASYNKFVGSVETRLIPTLRRFEEKGAHSEKKLSEPKVVEESIRPFRADLELAPSSSVAPAGRKGEHDGHDDAADSGESQALFDLGDDADRDGES